MAGRAGRPGALPALGRRQVNQLVQGLAFVWRQFTPMSRQELWIELQAADRLAMEPGDGSPCGLHHAFDLVEFPLVNGQAGLMAGLDIESGRLTGQPIRQNQPGGE